MTRSDTVNFISAGMVSPKKRDHQLARRQLYLNYGALSLATILKLEGYDCILKHGEHYSPELILEDLQNAGRFPSKHPLMLSIPSFYALSWAQRFCQLAKLADPGCRIIVGGRWVVGPDPEWLKSLLPEADELAPGLSEPYIKDLLNSRPTLRREAVSTPQFILDHTIIDGFENYQPSIEASRGCGMGCNFCEERDIPIEKLKHPALLAHSLATIQNQYNGEEIRPYFQSSMFLPTKKWAESLYHEIEKTGRKISWRTETRVDAMEPETLATLSAAGLRVIDLGLETASPKQIEAMNKTSKPDRYLRKAEDLLEACHKNGVMAKVNILLYAGEDHRTLYETQNWLDKNAKYIKGVSVGPVVAYGPPKTVQALLEDWKKKGASAVDKNSSIQSGITKMHLSGEIDAVAAEAISLDLSRRYMDSESYFSLKGFSYYPRSYRRIDFDVDVSKSDKEKLPFRVD